MSAFIGPIHYWLYGKIRLVAEREEYIYNKAAEMCGATAEELREQVWQTYGEPLADADLSELLDHDNIHGWLQRQINIAETREAAFIKELLDTCDGAAADLVEQAFAEHGKLTGESARVQSKHDISTAPGIYKALNDYYLNGMPCDPADTVVVSQVDGIVWDAAVCLQAPNWKRAGVSDKEMAKFYQAWIAGFVNGINPGFAYRRTDQERPAGNVVTRNEIYRK